MKTKRQALYKALSWLFFIIVTIVVLSVYEIRSFIQTNSSLVTQLASPELKYPLVILDSEGQVLQTFSEEDREFIKFDDIPKPFINALLSTEDKDFYSHSGVSIIGLLRAAMANILTGHKQGGSTITMQMAKNYLQTPEQTLSRKIKQIILALMIEKQYSKDQILELYLNKIFFGQRAYGIAAAAKRYYGVKLDQLSIDQDATLVGLIKAPSKLNPISSPKKSLARRNVVLQNMLDDHYISRKQYNQLIKQPLNLKPDNQRPKESSNHLAEMVRLEIEKMNPDYRTTGWHVYTTINKTLQDAAKKSIDSGIASFKRKFPPQAALVAINPNNGAILALVGGTNFSTNQVNHALTTRQIGSSIKPFIYAKAIESGKHWTDTIIDQPFIVQDNDGGFWAPQNSHDTYSHQPTTLEDALISSNNVITVQLLDELGAEKTLHYLENFGFIYSKQAHLDLDLGLSLALGTSPASPLQLATAYAVFDNGGYLVKPYFIEKITDPEGHVVYTHTPSTPQPVISTDNATSVSNVLHQVMIKGTGAAAWKALNCDESISRCEQLAGKTGTTNAYRDAWFSGYSPNIVTTVWVGYDKTDNLWNYAAQIALPIWIDFMKATLLANTPNIQLESITITPKASTPHDQDQLDNLDQPDNTDAHNEEDQEKNDSATDQNDNADTINEQNSEDEQEPQAQQEPEEKKDMTHTNSNHSDNDYRWARD